MFCHTHTRRLIAAAATVAALAGAPAASARPIDSDRYGLGSESQRVTAVRAHDEPGLNWADAGIGAAGMLALVLVGFGGLRIATLVPARQRSAAQS